MKRGTRWLLLVVALTLFGTGSIGYAQQPLKVIRYGSSDPVGTLVGFLNVLQQRFLAEYGYVLDVRWLNSDLVNSAFVAGQLDVIDAGAMAGPLMRQGGVDVKLLMVRSARSQYVLATHKSITDLKQLEGRSVGISAPGAISDIFSRAVLQAVGVDTDRVHFVRIGGTSARVGALLAGRIDAAPLFIDSAITLLEEGGDDYHILARVAEYIPLAFEDALWTRADYAAEHPDEIVALIKARLKMLDWIYENEEEFLQQAAAATGVDIETLRRTWEEYKAIDMWPRDGNVSEESLAFTMQQAYDTGTIEAVLPLEEWVDLSYLRRAQQEYAAEKAAMN